MTVAITKFTPKEIHINALFVQPTTLCALNCDGCYVKGGFDQHSESKELGIATLRSLIVRSSRVPDGFTTSLWLNQMTFAIDVIQPPDENGVLQEDSRILVNIFNTIRRAVRDRKSVNIDTLPEFHITIFSLQQMGRYVGYNDPLKVQEMFQPFDLISVSHLMKKDIHSLKTMGEHGLKINWNYQPYSSSVDAQVEKIAAILPHVHSMYYILHKPDTGKLVNLDEMNNYFTVLAKLKNTLSPELYQKIETDGCVTDAKKYLDTGFGCSSNISRFQVWPGGHVTGCPYKHAPTTGRADTLEQIYSNIRKAKEMYEFNKCKIPQALNPNHPRLEEDKHPYLRIIE